MCELLVYVVLFQIYVHALDKNQNLSVGQIHINGYFPTMFFPGLEQEN